MKKLFILMLLAILPGVALGAPYYFSGTPSDFNLTGNDNNLVMGSGNFDISIVGSQVTVTVNNTSATSLTFENDFSYKDGQGNVDEDFNAGTYDNASGISGFGFSLSSTSYQSWNMTAYDANGALVDPIGNEWALDVDPNIPNSVDNNYNINYLSNNGLNADGLLYNPLAVGSDALATLPNYFTTAILTIDFSDVVSLTDGDMFMRMQNVGPDGFGSLKLTGGGGGGGGTPVPEPSTFILLGAGLAGLVFYRRKKN